jgi:hypothetical protein
MSLHNAHVLLYLRWRHFLAVKCLQSFAQLHFYTLYQLELDVNWRPDHLR